VLDTINLERKGKPAAVVGQDKLVNTTGKAMAKGPPGRKADCITPPSPTSNAPISNASRC